MYCCNLIQVRSSHRLGRYPNADHKDAGPCSRRASDSVPRAHGSERSPLGTRQMVPPPGRARAPGSSPGMFWLECSQALPQGTETKCHHPRCHFARRPWTSRTCRAVATWNDSLGPGWTRGPLSSFALLPGGCPSSSPATGRSSERVGAVWQSWPHHCGPYFIQFPKGGKQYECPRKVPKNLQGVASAALSEPPPPRCCASRARGPAI